MLMEGANQVCRLHLIYIEPYLSLFSATGRYQQDTGNYIGKEEYPTVIAFMPLT